MGLACSLLLSTSLAFSSVPGFSQAPQETKDQQLPPKTETVSLKQPLAFGLEDGTPIKLRLTRNLSSADATTGDRVDFEVLERQHLRPPPPHGPVQAVPPRPASSHHRMIKRLSQRPRPANVTATQSTSVKVASVPASIRPPGLRSDASAAGRSISCRATVATIASPIITIFT